MKRIFTAIITACLLTAGMATMVTAADEIDYRAIQKKAEARQKEKASKKQASIDAATDARHSAECGGPGWQATLDTYQRLYAYNNGTNNDVISVVYRYARENNSMHGGMGGRQTADYFSKQFPGSSYNPLNGDGVFRSGNETWTMAHDRVSIYDQAGDDKGLNTHFVIPGSDGIATWSVTDGQSMVRLKINTIEPRRSRILDANLPVSLQRDVSEVFSVSKLHMSNKLLMSMLEGYYIDELQLKGASIQDFIVNLLTDPDTRDAFLEYSQRIAGLEAKKVK
jgi:hypothetical protein